MVSSSLNFNTAADMFVVCTSMVESNMLVRHFTAFPSTAHAMISWIDHGAVRQFKISDASYFFCMSYVKKSGSIPFHAVLHYVLHVFSHVFSHEKDVLASCLLTDTPLLKAPQ